MDHGQKQSLGFVDVADAGHDALVEHRITDLAISLSLDGIDDARRREIVVQQVGTERAKALVLAELGDRKNFHHWPVKEDDVVRGGGESQPREPGILPKLLPDRTDLP